MMACRPEEHLPDEAVPGNPWVGDGGGHTAPGIVLALAAVLATVVGFWPGSEGSQWDFNVYYAAARVMGEGGDPYDPARLAAIAATPGNLPNVYPPLALSAFRPFAWLPLDAARHLWFALKLAAAAGLFLIWNRHFLRLRANVPTVLFFLLAFDATLAADLSSGNVALLESLCLWHGFSLLVRGRPWPLAGYLILLAQVKVAPVALAAVFLVIAERPLWRPFLVTLAGAGSILALNPLFHPELTRRFATAAVALDERGILNPSSLAFFRDLVEGMRNRQVAVAAHLELVLYGAFAAWVLLLSVAAWSRRRGGLVEPVQSLFLACLVYALIVPRFKDYTYVLLLMPGLSALRRYRGPLAIPLLAALLLFPHPNSPLPLGARHLFLLLTNYVPLVAAFGLWIFYLREWTGARTALAPGSS